MGFWGFQATPTPGVRAGEEEIRLVTSILLVGLLMGVTLAKSRWILA